VDGETRAGLSAPGGQCSRAKAQSRRVLRLVQPASPASVAGLANTRRSVFQKGNADDGKGCVIRWRSDAVILWTVGCADARLTAQARSPTDKPGKRLAFPPSCPQVAAVHKLHSAPTAARIEFDSGKGATFNRLPALAYSSRNLSKRPGPPQTADARLPSFELKPAVMRTANRLSMN
jgi:hypothetical protein